MEPASIRYLSGVAINEVLSLFVRRSTPGRIRGRRSPMLRDGTYAAWFRTPIGHGTGIAHLDDGKIWGRDSIMTYNGSCQVDGDRFTALVSTTRHTVGHATVFGK